jgi:hypothetical protein
LNSLEVAPLATALLKKSVSGTRLGELAVPSINEINESPEFRAKEITFESFTSLWQEHAVHGV